MNTLTTNTQPPRIAIIGGGPAGLTAAYQLIQAGYSPIVFEQSGKVGGISRTEYYNGYRLDIGGHRFYTQVAEVEKLWHDIMGDDFNKVQRLSRIYYRGKYFKYPLEFFDALQQVGMIESVRILTSYLQAQFNPNPVEATFEQWVTNRFGKRLFNMFFKSYTEKVWGIPTHEIRADWAAQRIKDLSIRTILLNSIRHNSEIKTLINQFYYPRLGPGMMWERFKDTIIEGGGDVQMSTPIERITHDKNNLKTIITGDGQEIIVEHVISTMPLRKLISILEPAVPDEVQEAANKLKYRDFLIVGLIVNQKDLFPDNWIYIHSPQVRVGRIQNFKNWSDDMVPDLSNSSVGMEYFCNIGDDLWEMSDHDLIELAGRELQHLNLAKQTDVLDGFIIRQPKAYPVYDEHYQDALAVISTYLKTIKNLQTVGRNGMHRYNNQDHSMLTAMLAVQNYLGANHDLWTVNTERSYYEEFIVDKSPKQSVNSG
jgi:protoporphyrinogen oxidase